MEVLIYQSDKLVISRLAELLGVVADIQPCSNSQEPGRADSLKDICSPAEPYNSGALDGKKRKEIRRRNTQKLRRLLAGSIPALAALSSSYV